MKLTGAQIIMECLKEQNVDTVFGFPGGTVIALYNALYDYPEINHIPVSYTHLDVYKRQCIDKRLYAG